MPNHAEAGGTPVRVQAGDTLSAICARIYNIPASKTRKHWGEFARKDPKSGRLTPLTDPDRIFAGETLYHRPGGTAAGEVTGAAGVTDGVTNANPRGPTADELAILQRDMAEAKKLIERAAEVLKQVDRKGSVRALFLEEFPFRNGQSSAEQSAKYVAANYHTMLAAIGRVRYFVQDEMPVTAGGSPAAAFASGTDIAVWRQKYFVEWRTNRPARVQTLIHELAHVAFDAAHEVDEIPGGGAVLGPSTNAAERYASFASRLK